VEVRALIFVVAFAKVLLERTSHPYLQSTLVV
jgi:hypothetical protein